MLRGHVAATCSVDKNLVMYTLRGCEATCPLVFSHLCTADYRGTAKLNTLE